jgi:hypothetical protein
LNHEPLEENQLDEMNWIMDYGGFKSTDAEPTPGNGLKDWMNYMWDHTCLSFEINDYEYCLPHLLDQNETYRKHFEYAKESGSYIIMDNSLHELGEAYDTERLLHWIEHLEPNEFIVPDVWQDKTATLVNAKNG